MPTPPGVADTFTFESAADLSVDDEVWFNSAAWRKPWRRARVASIDAGRVRVIYRLTDARGTKLAGAPLERLRRVHFVPPPGTSFHMPAPKLQEVQKP